LEIAYSRFERRIDLPVVVEHAEIVTEYHAGMLLLRLRMQGEGP
jgi:HSP20 family molecular chaperone IbpA